MSDEDLLAALAEEGGVVVTREAVHFGGRYLLVSNITNLRSELARGARVKLTIAACVATAAALLLADHVALAACMACLGLGAWSPRAGLAKGRLFLTEAATETLVFEGPPAAAARLRAGVLAAIAADAA